MDPVSLALGIAPLCLASLKGAKHAKSKIKLLKHHDREVSRFRKRLRTQMSIFRDESQLLLQNAGVDRELAATMVENHRHPEWLTVDLEERIQSFLGKSYSELKDVAEEVREQVNKFDTELEKLEELEESPSRGKLAVTADRARRAVGVASKHSDLAESIEILSESVSEFRRLRKTAREFQKPNVVRPRQKAVMPPTYGLVARHSASFLESLSRSWSCLSSRGVHSTHTAKLFLETDASDSCVNFRMILEYEATSGSSREHSLLFLRIRSEELPWVDIGLPAPDLPPHQPPENPEPPKKARRVKFADSPSQASAMICRPLAAVCQKRRNDLARNLCQAKDVCRHVFECGKALHKSREEGCIGYLVSTDNLTHQLMAAQDRESTAIQTRPYSPASLASVIQSSKSVNISVSEQLRLALRLTQSVLHYHATPWWRRNWTLSDLSYFDIDTELSASLATLHIDAKLISRTDHLSVESVAADIPTLPSDVDGQVLCGIRNVTLHSLGVALTQIGRWELLDPDDVVMVRKAAERPSKLGPRYDQLTMKCLYCDFGFGGDLSKPQLQEAIYGGVVHELKDMITKLS